MSTLLLLKDDSICPRCHCRSVNKPSRVCNNCGVKLFWMGTFNFDKWEEETRELEYYGFHKFNGWMHQSQIRDPKPNKRENPLPKLPEGYGKHTTPEEVAARALRA